ncbi:MAG: MutS-related protein, partial [Gemmatimonadaceae bacterium]
MNAHLLHPDRDFDAGQPPRRHEPDLVQDLGLDTLCAAMGAGDEFLTGVARAGLLTGVSNDVAIVRYRQEVLRDCLAEPAAVRELYALAAEAIERSRRSYFGYLARSPGALLWGSVTLLEEFTGVLRRMRAVSERDGVRFSSRGFGALFAAMHAELDDAYLTEVEAHLKRLKFRHGMLVSAPLGARNEGAAYRLRLPSSDRPRWMQMIVGQADHGYSFRIDERDEAGARALGDLRDRAIDGVANAVSQAAEHVLG